MANGADNRLSGFFAPFRPWLAAAGAGLILQLFLLLFLIGSSQLSPALRAAVGNAAIDLWPLCHLAPWSPRLGWAWALGSTLLYWSVGIVLAVCTPPRETGLRDAVSALLLHATLALMFYTLVLLATIWALAAAGGQVPTLGQWVGWTGNHGPWRHICPLRDLLTFTLFVPVVAFLPAVLSFLNRPSWQATLLILGAVLAVPALFTTHYWLVD